MGETERGLRQGAGAGCGFCSMLVFLPVAFVVVIMYGCVATVDKGINEWNNEVRERKRVAARERQESPPVLTPAPRVAEISANDQSTMTLAEMAGLDIDKPVIASTLPEQRRQAQARADERDGKKIFIGLLEDALMLPSRDVPKLTTDQLILKREVDDAIASKVPGDMAMLDSVAGVSVGDPFNNVVTSFGEASYLGSPVGVEFFEAGWPGADQVAIYLKQQVAFVGADGSIDGIIAGIRIEDVKEKFPSIMERVARISNGLPEVP